MRFINLFLLACLSLPLWAFDPPTMGWSSWNTYRVHISDSLIMRQADALVQKGLANVGYRYINIDDGYFGGRDAGGTLLVHLQRFPGGLKPVVAHIHRLGLKAGIYSDAGQNTCGSFWDRDSIGIGVGFFGHDEQDARFFFDSLRFDFIKIDFCGGDAAQNFDSLQLSERERYEQIHRAIRAVRPKGVRLNICRWAFPGTWASRIASSWRITPDINPSWQSVRGIIAENRYLSAYATGGAYNDMDMLEVGRGLSEAEERTHFGLWCIQSSPLLIGCDLTAIPQSTLRLITNQELIAVNQDKLGLQASIVRAENGVYLYAKDLRKLHGKVRAVAVYNSTDMPQTFRLRPQEVLLDGKVRAFDLVNHTSRTLQGDEELVLTLAPHDTHLFRFEGGKRLMRQVYEAETAWLNRYQELGMNPELGYPLYAEDPTCSGGAKTTHVGNHADNWLEWRDIHVPRSGIYELRFTVRPAKWSGMFCEVNGVDTGYVEFFHDTPEVAIRTHLRKGQNTVRISNPDAWVPDLDKMEVHAVQ